MKTFFGIALLAACWSLVTAPAHAETLGFNESVHVCGTYRFDVTRVVDGFQIKVTDHSRTRALFYPDSFIEGGKDYNYSDVVSGCEGNAIAVIDRDSGKYDATLKANLIDPTGPTLRITQLAARETDYYSKTPTTQTTPESASSTLDALLARPADPWNITRPGLVDKHQIAPEAPSMLNDTSYYVFNAAGSITKKFSPSTWHTTEATDAIDCDGVTYVVYEKKYAADGTQNSTPPEQYVIERTTATSRTLIPIPWQHGAWTNAYDLLPFFRECFGKNAALGVAGRMTMVTPKTVFTDYLNPRTSIEPEYRDGVYYQAGSIWLDTDSAGTTIVKGDATLHILNADGTVTDRKPVFFKDIRQLDAPASLEFYLDLTDKKLIDVVYYQGHPGNVSENTTFQERNGTYSQITHDPYNWTDAYIFRYNQQITPLDVSAERGMLTIKSYFLPGTMLLHYLPNTNYTLLWNRVGPTEHDGTRKIWYAIKVNGRTETWLARIR